MTTPERRCPDCGREVSPAATRCPGCGRPLEPTARSGAQRSSSRGMWLLLAGGCGLAVMVFGSIFAAILIPNFLDALQKAKQKRTMADLRDWGVVLESYRVDHDGAVPAASSLEEVAGLLDPELAVGLATTDGWQRPIRYACWSEALEIAGCDTYRLVSAGRDGVFEHDDPAAYDAATFEPIDYDADLVLGDGVFHRYPGPPP